MKRNPFITAALEELSQEADEGAEKKPVVVAAPATSAPNDTASKDGVGEAPQPALTELNLDQAQDAVAALMEKNSALEDAVAELQEQNFDNDLDALDTSSDSVHEDLEEAVAAGAALEELAHLASMTAKSGMANKASVASLAFALEQISERAGVSGTAALEDSNIAMYNGSSADGAKAQAEGVAKAASDQAQGIYQKLVAGIQRIIGWIMNVVRQVFSRYTSLTGRIAACSKELDSIDEDKTIDSKPFISSLRLVKGAGDPDKQFKDYAQLASKTLFGFFNNSFATRVVASINHLKEEESDDVKNAGMQELTNVLRAAMSVIYTEHGNGADAGVPKDIAEKDLTVGLTPPTVGGGQLYLAATLDGGEKWYCRGGVAKKQPEFDMPDSIPVVNKATADHMFGIITKWILAERELQHVLGILRGSKIVSSVTGVIGVKGETVHRYLSTLSALATGVMPHLLRLNYQNSVNFITYVEKSIAVSKASYAEKK